MFNFFNPVCFCLFIHLFWLFCNSFFSVFVFPFLAIFLYSHTLTKISRNILRRKSSLSFISRFCLLSFLFLFFFFSYLISDCHSIFFIPLRVRLYCHRHLFATLLFTLTLQKNTFYSDTLKNLDQNSDFFPLSPFLTVILFLNESG